MSYFSQMVYFYKKIGCNKSVKPTVEPVHSTKETETTHTTKSNSLTTTNFRIKSPP